METANLELAYEGSYYTILGAGGDLTEWVAGYNGMLQAAGIGTPAHWYTTTGREINAYAATKGDVTDPFQDDLTALLFPLDGLTGVGALAVFKIQNGDRWMDDIVNNMVAGTTDDEYDDGEE